MDTPTLLLDLDQLDRNIEHIMQFAKENGVAYRPHIKTHKSTNIAKKQMAAGAVGVTVATVGEAEVMAEAGIPSILLAYPISKQEKLERIQPLLEQTEMVITVDSAEQAKILNNFFTEYNQKVQVWMKVNTGLNRCGIEPEEEVLEL